MASECPAAKLYPHFPLCTLQSHKITDLTGTASFALSAIATHAATCRALGTPALAPSRGALLAGCVSLWSLRLGGYLFYRVLQVQAEMCCGCVHAGLRCAEACCLCLVLVRPMLVLPGAALAVPRYSTQSILRRSLSASTGRQGRPPGPVLPAARRAAADGPQQVSRQLPLWRSGTGSGNGAAALCTPVSERTPLLAVPRSYPLRLAFFWTMQGLWSFIGLLPVTAGERRR